MTRTKKTPLERMRVIVEKSGWDKEADHFKADQLLCSLVREFVPNGREVIKEYNSIKKWYS